METIEADQVTAKGNGGIFSVKGTDRTERRTTTDKLIALLDPSMFYIEAEATE